MSRLTRDGTAETVSRDQTLRYEQHGQGNINFPCSADHEQDWQPYPVDPYYSCYNMGDHTYIHNIIFLTSYLNLKEARGTYSGGHTVGTSYNSSALPNSSCATHISI